MEVGAKDSSVAELQREEVINSIVSENNLRFEDALKTRERSAPPAIFDEALVALIPRALYQKSSDPTKIEPYIWRPLPERVFFDVVGFYSRRRDRNPVKDRMLSCSIDTLRTHPQTLIVGDFNVGLGLKRRGVGREFYDRLEHVARALGFRFILGENSIDNIDFFIEKLGRTRLVDIKPDLWSQIIPPHKSSKKEGINPNLTTVQFLNPEDKSTFAID